jgi:hypothetical protein
MRANPLELSQIDLQDVWKQFKKGLFWVRISMKKRFVFFYKIVFVFFFWAMASASAFGQALPPDRVRLTTTATGNYLQWIDGGNDGATTLIRYEIGRSTTRGGGYTVIGNTTGLFYIDNTGVAGTTYYYVIRDVNSGGTSAWSDEIIRFYPFDAATADAQIYKSENAVRTRWPIYQNEIVKTFVGLSTTPGQADLTGFIDVGHATEHTFTGLSLQEGTTFYVTVRVQSTKGSLYGYGTSTCSSDGFVFDMARVLTDETPDGFFNNAAARVMTRVNAGSVETLAFGNDALRRYRMPVTLIERGIESRFNAPVEINVSDGTLPNNINQGRQRIRVADEWGNEVPSNVTACGGGQATVVLIANLPKGGSRNYWVYWGGGSADYPAFISNSNDTSQRAWSQYYSRKLLPPGIETDPISSWTKLAVTVGDWYDRGGTWVTLPWAFPYFATTRSDWFLAIKGTLTGVDYRDYSNTWNEFIANAANRDMISALWLDTAIRDTDPQPQDIGFYTLLKDSGQPDERQGFFWRANRYGELDDIYMFQTFLYRYGDIAHRYEYLTYAGLWVQGTWDNPVNLTENTVGISDNNNNDYFWSTPLREGIGQTPTSFFQYKNAVDYSLGAVEDAGAGGIAGHFDSHIFDSRAATPNWQTMEYEVTANGGRFHFLLRSGPTPEPDGTWTGWTQVQTNVNTNGSVAVPAANNHRYIQYRCVFLKAATGNNPLLNRVNFICRGLEITQVTANTPDGVSQGQQNIPVTVNVKNFHSADIDLTDLELLFDLGSYTQTLSSHVLPTTIPAGGDIDFEFMVDVWEDSPTGLATIHATATGTESGITFADQDADTPHSWLVLSKADLYIKQIDATPTTVNKGQTVLVRMLLENHGESAFVFDAATLTFSLGSYDQLVTAPAPGTQITGGGSMIATLSVTVKPESPSGVAVIDGTATGFDLLSNKVASDTDAEITDSWIIQNPAELVLKEVIAPSLVYRGQTNVLVKLLAENIGEAELDWDQSFIMPYFTLGTYDSVNEVSSFPIILFGGLSAEGEYHVNIAPDTVTGVSDVDAKIEGTDKNTGFAVEDEFAVFPASWTIIQEYVNSFNDAALLFESDSFNRPEGADTITVYAKAQSLAPFQEYTIRWFDPSGTQVAYTNPPLTSDDTGEISHQLALDSTADYGLWSIKVTDPLNTHIACENQFAVVTPAGLSVDLQIPAKVTVAQPFNASFTFINTGGAEIESAYPGSLVKNGPGDANFSAGPNPALHDIPGLEQATFSYDLAGTVSGNFSLDGTGYGFDANSGDAISAATVTSNVCEIQDPPQLSITDLSADQIEVNLNQQGIEVLLSIYNEPSVGIIPPDYYLYDTGTENVTFVAGYSEGTGDSQLQKQATQLLVRARGEVFPGAGWNPDTYETAERTYVTDVQVDLTGVNFVHIRWRNTGDNNANNQSYFVISPNKNGDHSVSTLNITRTRNFGWVEESIGVGGLTGNHFIRIHARDNNPNAQVDSVINVEQIWLEYAPAAGGNQAGAYVEAASLTFDFGTHTQIVDSPAFPFLLAPGDTQIITFLVAVDTDSDIGMVNITGSVLARDENWNEMIYGVTGGNHFWEILGVRGVCSANSSYNPEQYAFNIGQTVYARFENLALNQDYRIRFYNDSPLGGTLVKTSPPLNSGAFGICDDLWTLDAADPNTITRQWRVIIDDGNAGTVGNIFATQYFEVQNPGTMVATLTLAPDSCFVGETITAYLSVTNPNANASTIELASATNLVPTSLSVGELTPDLNVTPASATIAAEKTATFTWTFTATDDTGLVGSYSMTADSDYSSAGYDHNESDIVESNKAISNSIFIYRRSIEVASSSIIHAALEPGDTSDSLIFRVDNTGNYKLDAVKWAIADLKNELSDYISKSKLTFTPQVIGLIDAGNSEVAQNSIEIPFNQPAGTYIATMSVYEDLDGNDNRDFTEPFDLFSVEVEVLSAKKIVLSDDFIDLGNWASGQITVAHELEIINAGNLDLDRVRLRQTAGTATFILASPSDQGAFSVGQTKISDIYADIPGGTTDGIYIATWTVFEDDNDNTIYEPGEPFAQVQVRIGIGDKSFTIAPASIDAGYATPTFVIEDLPFNVTNTGMLGLGNLTALPGELKNGSGDIIASDNIVIFPPAFVGVSATEGGTVNFYTPAGQTADTYTGTQWIFDDDNLNGRWDAGEASASFELSVEVILYPAILVLSSTVDIGDLSAGTGGSKLFWCRNIGNVTLTDLRWNKVDLFSSTDTIPATEYYFPPAEPFTAAPGDTFQREISINVPAGVDDGIYVGNVGFLYEDMETPLGSRQPTEPQDSFQIALRVGNHSLDILEALVTTSGPPSSLSDPGVFTIENTGTLTVSKPRATATVLLGPETIPAAASVFTPFPIGSLVTGQTRSVTWRVNVPANTLAGTYNGMVTVWNDSNNNGLIDAGEAQTTAPLEFEVTAKRIIEVLPAVFDLGWATENSTTEGSIEIINRGNVVLTDLRGLAGTLTNASMDTISNITFIPDPIGNLAIGDSFIATVSVTVGAPQSTGVYSGVQRIYDDYLAPSGSYTASEESDTFELRISIGRKQVDVTPNVTFAATDPGVTVNSPLFTASNLTVIPLTRLKWAKTDLDNGTDIIPAASLTFSPPIPPATSFGLGSSASNNSCQASLVIGPYTPQGTYHGNHTLWEDDNNNGLIDAGEASATFITQIDINPLYDLDIVPTTIDLGTVQAGNSSALVDVDVINMGNTVLSDFNWNFVDLFHVDGKFIDATVLDANITAPLNPGQTVTAQVYLNATPAELDPGIYQSSGHSLAGNGGASDNCEIIVNIEAGNLNMFDPDTVNQEINSSNFNDLALGQSAERFILSGMVNPGSGAASIAFYTVDTSDAPGRVVKISVNSSGITTIDEDPPGSIVSSGYTIKVPHPDHPSFTPAEPVPNWYRIYIAFDFAFDSANEKSTYIVLANESAVNHAVWFDAIQLEKAVFEDQELPTAYSRRKKIISPNQSSDLHGTDKLFRW